MSRDELISEIMRQVREATDDGKLRRDTEFRLRLTATAVLREIYSTNAVSLCVKMAHRRLSFPASRTPVT